MTATDGADDALDRAIEEHIEQQLANDASAWHDPTDGPLRQLFEGACYSLSLASASSSDSAGILHSQKHAHDHAHNVDVN